jgi:hypothetical protein
MIRCWICRSIRCQCLLAKDWQPQPEGRDAQPIWNGSKQTEQDRHIENNPAFE